MGKVCVFGGGIMGWVDGVGELWGRREGFHAAALLRDHGARQRRTD